jgi:hypothetical protein
VQPVFDRYLNANRTHRALSKRTESGTLVESARPQDQLLTPADPSLTLTRTQRVATSGKPEKRKSLT